MHQTTATKTVFVDTDSTEVKYLYSRQ